MNKETYERMSLVITEFDTEDVIMTSAPGGGSGSGGSGSGGTSNLPSFAPTDYEVPLGI